MSSTGSGKSTLINLLCRFYEVDSGQILLDGVNVKDLSQEQLRESIAVVLQDVFLFSGSVEENVRLWDKPMSDTEIEWATQQVHAHSFIREMPEGYSTTVTERGSSLSAGQRQLLAFARARAHAPQILVLDEATSSVDTARSRSFCAQVSSSGVARSGRPWIGMSRYVVGKMIWP